jgi:predicted nucleic acid-binding protein
MRIYLDVCCLNRPFDDQTQDRIRLESEALLLILKRLRIGEWTWVGSEVIEYEIQQAPDSARRQRVSMVARHAGGRVRINDAIVDRARELERLGFGPYDALHLSCAEAGRADLFLTTDDRLVRMARRHAKELALRVENPLAWIEEAYRHEH